MVQAVLSVTRYNCSLNSLCLTILLPVMHRDGELFDAEIATNECKEHACKTGTMFVRR